MSDFRIETERLVLRELGPGDEEFICELVNEPDWIRYIGDRGVKNEADAANYIKAGPAKMYEEFGHGLWAMEAKETDEAVGICGVLKRPDMDLPDLGFAVLSKFRRRGYSLEASKASLVYCADRFGYKSFAAITTLDNAASGALLEKLDFEFRENIEVGKETLRLFVLEAV
ncbi:MAG: GNAT family N-acetyltransferase [Pyrinomonadaceae bacterium]